MFQFRFEKAMQAAAALLRRELAQEMSYLRLLKLLYIADRESLKETGRPITGDRPVSMKWGPVLSGLFDVIKGQHLRSPEWDNFIKKEGYQVRLLADPGIGKLCRYEAMKLEEVSERYRQTDDWTLVNQTHEFPEWKDPGSTSAPISLAELLAALGREKDIAEIEAEAQAEAESSRLFGGR